MRMSQFLTDKYFNFYLILNTPIILFLNKHFVIGAVNLT